MCSMTYLSEFTGIWNGKEMVQISGDLKFPEELNAYITIPIEKVRIQSKTYYLGAKEIAFFQTDTLITNQEYSLSGELVEIVDGQPTFKVNIQNF